MSFQSEYKITAADRQDKGVTGLPDTPNMPTTVIQERFDSLGNLAIDKFNALVDGASDSVDGSDTKFPTNKAIVDYISGEGGAIIDDNTPSTHKTYSSSKVENMYAAIPGNLINDTTPSSSTVYSGNKVENMFAGVSSRVINDTTPSSSTAYSGNKIENMFANVSDRIIDDSTPSSSKTYSSEEIEQKIADIPTPESFIDDDNVSTETTFSSRKISDNYIGFAETEEQTATDEFSTINGGLLSECKVALSPNQDLHGYENPWVGGAGKNKLPLVLADIKANNTAGTWSGNVYTFNGITFTIQTDNSENITSINVSGTATTGVSLLIKDFTEYLFSENNYILNDSVNASAISSGSCYMSVECRKGASGNINYSANTKNASRSEAFTVNYSQYDRYRVLIYMPVNTVVNNAVFYPMIRLATETDPTFAPYSNICPISGHTQVEVQNHQKNLLDPNNPDLPNIIVAANSTLDVNNSFNTWKFEGGHVYTFSYVKGTGFDTLRYGTEVNGVLTRRSTAISPTVVDATNVDTLYISLAKATDYLSNFQLELGSTATPYEPYNGYQVTVNLGGTYYSGTLDVVSGVFTPDMAEKDLSTLTFRTVSQNRWLSDSIISEVKHPSSSDLKIKFWSDSYYYTNAVDLYFNLTLIGIAVDNEGNILCRNNDANPPTGHIVYELATPTSIQLSPTMVKALVGENHLSAPLEGQEITESKYRYLFTWDIVEDELNKLSDSIDEVSDDLSDRIDDVSDSLGDRIDDVEETLDKTHYSSAVSCAIDDTTCTISDANITTSSLIEPFYSNTSGDNVVIKNQTVTTGQVVLTFDALLEATSFSVRITNL